MFAISLLQPWAWAILYAGKDIENRTWALPRCRIGSRVLLHASKNVTRVYYQDAVDTISALVPSVVVPYYEQIAKGAIVGAVTFVRSLRPASYPTARWHFAGQFGWVVRDPVALTEPIPCRGALGFWHVPDAVAARVRELARAA